MREISILSFISIDGVAQGPTQPGEDPSGGFEHSGWMAEYFDDAMKLVNGELMEAPISFLFGRKTYEMFMPHWSSAPKSAHAELLNNAPKLVVSNSLKEPGWTNSQLISGDVVASLRAISKQDGPRLQVHGSIELIQTLLAHDLIGELRLLTFPVVVGTGRKLFADTTPLSSFKLTRSNVTDMGITMNIYRRETL
ncbi:MAG: dihydrofolate reductase family protein [Pseudomonadota bacterium]